MRSMVKGAAAMCGALTPRYSLLAIRYSLFDPNLSPFSRPMR
jgi:hypothetical protein